jgi:hypothetical protein
MLSDNLSKEIIVPKMGNESFDINEKGYREVAILNKEQFNLLDKISSAILFVINEYASFEEKQLIDYQTVRKENLRIADKRPSFDFDCLYSESVNVVEFYKDLISFLLLVTESLGIIEASAKDYNLNKFENLLAEELKQYNNVTKLSKEPINFSENLDRSLSFLRVFNEYVTMSEKPIKNINKRSYEVFSLLDAYLRNANAIISDVVIKNFEMTFIDFDNTDIPAGFSSFKDLITGEYTYEKAMLKLVLGAEINANRPNIQRFELNVDVEDVVDRGSVYIPAGDASQPVRVYFNKSFNIVPEVGIYLKGGTDINAKPFIVGVITLEYFDVELKVNETYVAGTVGWQAIGY